MKLGQPVQEGRILAFLARHVDVRVLHSEQELAPLEQVAADGERDGAVGGFVEARGRSGDLIEAFVGEGRVEWRRGNAAQMTGAILSASGS